MGKIIPLTAPAKINNLTGLPILIKIMVERIMKALIIIFSLFFTAGTNVFQKETEVKDAPTTDVMAADHITMPKNLYPSSPAAD